MTWANFPHTGIEYSSMLSAPGLPPPPDIDVCQWYDSCLAPRALLPQPLVIYRQS